jgi:hypothetical protein
VLGLEKELKLSLEKNAEILRKLNDPSSKTHKHERMSSLKLLSDTEDSLILSEKKKGVRSSHIQVKLEGSA